MMKNKRAARAARTSVEFSDVVCQKTREISKFKDLAKLGNIRAIYTGENKTRLM